MKILNNKRSTWILNLLIAIVITLTVNFSYLLSMIVEQREANEQQTTIAEEVKAKPEINGVLHISRDGYGYVVTTDTLIVKQMLKERRNERLARGGNNAPQQGRAPMGGPNMAGSGNSIPQRLDGGLAVPQFTRPVYDSIYVNSRRIYVFKLKDGDSIRCTIHPPRGNSSPSVDEILLQNGVEPAPITYDRPSREHEMLIQLLYYLVLSFILLSIMTVRIKNRRLYLQRCAIAVAAVFACYFCAPYVNWYTGKMAMIFQDRKSVV